MTKSKFQKYSESYQNYRAFKENQHEKLNYLFAKAVPFYIGFGLYQRTLQNMIGANTTNYCVCIIHYCVWPCCV